MHAIIADPVVIPPSCRRPRTNGVSDPSAAPTWYDRPGPTPRTAVGKRSVRYEGAMPQMPPPDAPMTIPPTASVALPAAPT